jgi:hypothetical protein
MNFKIRHYNHSTSMSLDFLSRHKLHVHYDLQQLLELVGPYRFFFFAMNFWSLSLRLNVSLNSKFQV